MSRTLKWVCECVWGLESCLTWQPTNDCFTPSPQSFDPSLSLHVAAIRPRFLSWESIAAVRNCCQPKVNPTLLFDFYSHRLAKVYSAAGGKRSQVSEYAASRPNKVVTAMVIGPLDDHTYYARSAFTHLELWRKRYDHLTTSQCMLKCDLLIFSSTSNRFAEIWKWDFSTPTPPVWG